MDLFSFLVCSLSFDYSLFSENFVNCLDLRQVMKSCLRINEDSGSVSAMAIKRDNSRLLCGYSRGNVSLWNLHSGELIKIFNDLHSPNTTVLHLKVFSIQ